MRKKVVIMMVLCILLAIGVAIMLRREDRVAPIITAPDAKVSYVEGNDGSLLDDVKAYDDRDGDVSDSLYVKTFIEEEKGYVIYYAKDKSNNISMTTRELEVSVKPTSTPE